MRVLLRDFFDGSFVIVCVQFAYYVPFERRLYFRGVDDICWFIEVDQHTSDGLLRTLNRMGYLSLDYYDAFEEE